MAVPAGVLAVQRLLVIVQLDGAPVDEGVGDVVAAHVEQVAGAHHERGALAGLEAAVARVDAQDARSIEGDGLQGGLAVEPVGGGGGGSSRESGDADP